MEYVLANPVPVAVFAASLLACRSSDKQTRDRGFISAALALAYRAIEWLYEWLSGKFNKASKYPKRFLETLSNMGLQWVGALKVALNSVLPGLGKLLEPFESFFQWLKENAGSVAQVIVMVVGGYIVLKVIRR